MKIVRVVIFTVQYRAFAKCLFWRQVYQTWISLALVWEVVSTTTLECWTLSLCGSDIVFVGLSKPLNLNRKQRHYNVWKMFLIKLTFRFTLFNQYLPTKQELTSRHLAPSSDIASLTTFRAQPCPPPGQICWPAGPDGIKWQSNCCLRPWPHGCGHRRGSGLYVDPHWNALCLSKVM